MNKKTINNNLISTKNLHAHLEIMLDALLSRNNETSTAVRWGSTKDGFRCYLKKPIDFEFIEKNFSLPKTIHLLREKNMIYCEKTGCIIQHISNYYQRKASEVGIEPVYIEGMEKHGLNYFLSHGGNAVGGQCSTCHTIVWTNARLHPITSEKRPEHIPASGPIYKRYYNENIKRFLLSLPPCPACGDKDFDHFVSNYSFARYQDGKPWSKLDFNTVVKNEAPSSIYIWCLEQLQERKKHANSCF